MSILDDEDYRIINMDETGKFLEMGFSTTIDFKGNKNIKIDSYGRDQYRITVILSVAGDGTKLSPMTILKGESGATIEKNMNKLNFVKNKDMFIFCQKNALCEKVLFMLWINKIFLPYQNLFEEKVLIIFDQTTSHVSNDSLEYLANNNIDFLIIHQYDAIFTTMWYFS